MLFISRAKKTYIPQQWRGWLYGGKNQNTKKSLDQKFPPPPPPKKIPYRTTRPKYASTTTNLYLYQAAQDNTCPIFLLQKLPESKISNPKKSFYHRRHLKSGVPPLGFCSTSNLLIERFAYDVLHSHKTDYRIRSWIAKTEK